MWRYFARAVRHGNLAGEDLNISGRSAQPFARRTTPGSPRKDRLRVNRRGAARRAPAERERGGSGQPAELFRWDYEHAENQRSEKVLSGQSNSFRIVQRGGKEKSISKAAQGDREKGKEPAAREGAERKRRGRNERLTRERFSGTVLPRRNRRQPCHPNFRFVSRMNRSPDFYCFLRCITVFFLPFRKRLEIILLREILSQPSA